MKAPTRRQAGFIEGYAAALHDLLVAQTGDGFSAKSYDPMTVDLKDGVMHSYAFDLKDGGRHHPFSDYASIEEICELMKAEVLNAIAESK